MGGLIRLSFNCACAFTGSNPREEPGRTAINKQGNQQAILLIPPDAPTGPHSQSTPLLFSPSKPPPVPFPHRQPSCHGSWPNNPTSTSVALLYRGARSPFLLLYSIIELRRHYSFYFIFSGLLVVPPTHRGQPTRPLWRLRVLLAVAIHLAGEKSDDNPLRGRRMNAPDPKDNGLLIITTGCQLVDFSRWSSRPAAPCHADLFRFFSELREISVVLGNITNATTRALQYVPESGNRPK